MLESILRWVMMNKPICDSKYKTHSNVFGVVRMQALNSVEAPFYFDVPLGLRVRRYVYFGHKVKRHVKCDVVCGFF